VLSGEGALNQVLTSLDNKQLLQVARSRGIDVTREAQLKPGVADQRVIKKIIDDFSPDELQDFRDQYLENSRMETQAASLSPEAQRLQLLQAYFPDVKIPAAATVRYQKQLQTRIPLSTLLEAGR
jgi:hypothetical protein